MRPHRSILVLAVVALAALAADAPKTLRDEDVVRLHVAGKSADALVELIRSSAVDFDLSTEMVEELRLAGIPDRVVRAMQDRQAEIDAADRPPEAEAPPEPAAAPVRKVVIALDLEGGVKKSDVAMLRYPPAVPDRFAEAHELGHRPEDRAVAGIALFVACVSPTHVPDYWRSESPLGRDFVLMPRHRLLLFRSSATAAVTDPNAKPSKKDVELEIPKSVELEIAPGEAHELLLGVAIEVGGKYLRISSGKELEVEAGDAPLRLVGHLRREGGEGLPLDAALELAPETP